MRLIVLVGFSLLFSFLPSLALGQSQGLDGLREGFDNPSAQSANTGPEAQAYLQNSCEKAFDDSDISGPFCRCFSSLMGSNFPAADLKYYGDLLLVEATTQDGSSARQRAMTQVGVDAYNNGMTQKRAEYIRREGRVMLNYASAHVRYGDACRKPF